MLKRSSPPVGAKGNEVKYLANVSCQVPARDPSDATLCQDDIQRGEKVFLYNFDIIVQINIRPLTRNFQLSIFNLVCTASGSSGLWR